MLFPKGKTNSLSCVMSLWQQSQVAGNHTARSVTFPWAGTVQAYASGPALFVTRGMAGGTGLHSGDPPL